MTVYSTACLYLYLCLFLVKPWLAWSADGNPNIVKVDDHLAVEVFSQGILRVFRCAPDQNASAEALMQQRESLVVLKQPSQDTTKVDFQVDRNDTTISITTDLIVAHASRSTGDIVFLDRTRDNAVFVQESGASVDVDSSHETTMTQQWNLSSPDEAMYGGGQFVNGQLNYRSAPIQWIQFNTEAVVPFLLSSNHYGILWDLYGETMMNKPQENIALTQQPDGKNFTGVFTPTSPGDYWFYVEACQGTFGCNGMPHPLILSLMDPQEQQQQQRTICEHSLANVPHSIACRVTGLIMGHTYHVLLFDDETSGNKDDLPTVSYTSIDTHNKLTLETQATHFIDYYFVANGETSGRKQNHLSAGRESAHESLDGVIANYRRLTGTAYLYGRWVYGFWQCKEHYGSQQGLSEAAAKFRQLRIPVDSFVQDWLYWGDLGWGPQWDPKIYPDPKAMIQQLHDANIHFMVSVWSRFDTKTKFYKILNDAGVIIADASEYMDAWDPLARNLFFQFVDEAHFSIGADALWLDATEPERSKQRGKKIHLGTGNEYANSYSLMVAKAVFDGLKAKDPHTRVFSLTRSSFAGQQRYGAALWSGDTSGTWDSLRRQITMSTNYQLSGIPYWSMDTGGFVRPSNQYTDPDYHHLLTRWFQFAVFTPIFRVHGGGSNTELWNYGQDLQDLIVDSAIRFRYRLLEYIYSGFHRVEAKGYTMQRGLVLDFWYDKAVHDIPDQFMFGDSFLVAPIYSPNSRRDVYLPKLDNGKWRSFWSGKEFQGGQTVAIVGMSQARIPLFVRSSILVLGPDGRQHVDDHIGVDRLEVRVYDGMDSQFVLFEDDGVSGDPSRPMTTIAFSWDDSSRMLSIGDRDGTPVPGVSGAKTFDITLVRADTGVGISPSKPDVMVAYNGKAMTVQVEPDNRPLRSEVA
jgi:alpha-D-xyloside xylohydrolase